MNAARHLAWMLNPNLDQAAIERLMRQEEEAFDRHLAIIQEQVARIASEHGKLAAIRYLNQCLTILFL